ncbi:MAG: Gfo/Idh/MocA family oxidoreductase [Defluviitaleaceae bacterium]|nr:Gfo/Idh/MocA family oxidoreductase [Defluviitaleaceae bacterium]
MERIKLGIIGLGLAWERLHAPALNKLKDRYEIVAVCDTDITKARNAASTLGLPEDAVYNDYNKMLARTDIEAVESLVPIRGNYETAAAVITSGKHLIAEKPLASTPDAARELIKLRNQAGVKVMVAENVRYEEQNVLIKSFLDGGHIGNPVYFVDNHIVDYQQEAESGGFGQTAWRKNPEFEGGVLLDSGVHHIARLRHFFGDAIRVYAQGRPSGVSFAPYSCITGILTFPENITGHYSFFLTGKETQSPLVGFRIFGTHGEIYLEEPNCGFVNITYKDGRESGVIPYSSGQGYLHELEDFHAALRFGARIESTPEKALGDIETIFAITESARLNESIDPGEPTRLSQAFVLPRVAAYPGSRV